MKLKNRIMSWILHPSAYMVWVALGVPEDWVDNSSNHDAVYVIRHKRTLLDLWVKGGRFFLDGYNKWEGTIGLLDRHFLWWRAARVKRLLHKKQDKRQKLFVLMTEL